MKPHPFVWGRAVLAAFILVALAELASFWRWRSTFGDDPGAAFLEICPVLTTVLVAALIAPKMATWEALGDRRVRWCAGATATAALSVLSATPVLVYAVITVLPHSAVPDAQSAAVDELTLGGFLPLVTNIMTVAGAAMIAVAALGRVLGAIVALVSYATLFWLSASGTTPVPYSALSPVNVERPTWLVSTIILVAAAVVWFRTGGSTDLSRRIDPRHRGQ